MRASLRLFFFISSLVLIISGTADVAAKTVPITREHIAQAWVGMSSDGAYVYRLALNADGTGAGAFVFLDQDPCAFRIKNWTYKKGSVSIDIESPPSECVVGRGFAAVVRGSAALELTMFGKDWRERCILQREAAFFPRWKRLSDLMNSL
jgi:hypothetical protein